LGVHLHLRNKDPRRPRDGVLQELWILLLVDDEVTEL
jgi:hypothetical protein